MMAEKGFDHYIVRLQDSPSVRRTGSRCPVTVHFRNRLSRATDSNSGKTPGCVGCLQTPCALMHVHTQCPPANGCTDPSAMLNPTRDGLPLPEAKGISQEVVTHMATLLRGWL